MLATAATTDGARGVVAMLGANRSGALSVESRSTYGVEASTNALTSLRVRKRWKRT
jgi:hypothetical protein